ncbi:TonB-dependent receptor [Sandarakinorhabdus oryzae]|uniref:TonB-dependent receptor n=1 Tax=Sandarakinorhabdus oryzae TaxID=2675220 RepID=UPI0012E2141A|nr:TonB-dependent receptor [Sandarakinorhabdus oryzae]
MSTRETAGNLALRAVLLLGVAAPLALAAPAAAQTAAADEAGDDEIIIVTASKQAKTLQDTPISVQVTGKQAIETAQIRDALDLQTLVPSLRVSQLQSSANTNFIIRGFGNGANNAGIEPSVGVFIDGVYRSRSAAQIGDLPSLERIEVLRGPQSTLFGKNASAGIISVVTAEPKFKFGGQAELSYGNYNALVAKADITGPITDTIAFSLAGNYNRRDGYVYNTTLKRDENERNRGGVRAQLLFKPSDDFKLRIIGDYDRIDEVCCSVVNIVDGPTGNAVRALGGQIISNQPLALTSTSNFGSTNKIDNYGVSAQADYKAGQFDLTFITAYRGVRLNTNQDSDFTSADIIGSNNGRNAINTFTAEARIASKFDGPLNFLLGAFYFDEKIDAQGSLTFGRDFKGYANLLSGGNYSGLEPTLRALLPGTPAGAFGTQGQGRFEDYDYKNRAISIFGTVDWNIFDNLTFTAGGNFTHDTKRVATNSFSTDVFSGLDLVRAGVNAGVPATLATNPAFNPFLALRPLQFLPPFLNFPNAVEDGRTKDNNFSYTLRLSWKANDNLNFYATHATGFKASSWNLSFDSRPFASDFIPGSPAQSPAPAASPIRTALGANLPNNLTTGSRYANPEYASVIELGMKGQWEGFAVNLALFRQILTGFQSNVFSGTGFILANADKQSANGVELDTSFSPSKNLRLTANFTYLDSKFDSFPGGAALVTGSYSTIPVDLTGQRVAGVPRFSLSVGGDYTAHISDEAKLMFHVDFQHESPTQIAQGTVPLQREISNLNASATLALNSHLEFTVWGRNITDQAYVTTIFPGVAQAGTLSGYRNQPRTFGGLVRYRF